MGLNVVSCTFVHVLHVCVSSQSSESDPPSCSRQYLGQGYRAGLWLVSLQFCMHAGGGEGLAGVASY